MILVTGGAGYIGGVFVERLLREGESVCILDDLSRGHRDALPTGVPFFEGDIGDRALLSELFSRHKIESIVHFAAYALVGESMQNAALYFHNNLGQTLALLEESLKAGVGRFVFSSTCAIYGDRNPSPISEGAAKQPINPYGASKLAVEEALAWYHRVHGLSYFCLRYFNACGATAERGERHDPETHLIPLVLEAAAGERDSIQIFGDDYPTPDGTCIRDYIHVEDLADAHLTALRAPAEASGGYNLGTGRGHSVREVIETCRRVTGKPIREAVAPRREGDPPELVADPRRIQEKLGWRARRDLDSAVRSAWEFKKKHAVSAA